MTDSRAGGEGAQALASTALAFDLGSSPVSAVTFQSSQGLTAFISCMDMKPTLQSVMKLKQGGEKCQGAQ